MLLQCARGKIRDPKLPLLHHNKESVENVLSTCFILRNMPHDYHEMDELEKNMDSVSADRLHKAWIKPPQQGESSVGRRSRNESVEFEAAFNARKELLITPCP